MWGAPRSRVRPTSISVLRRRHVWSTTVPLRRLTVPVAGLLADSTRSLPSLPELVDRGWSDGDGLPAVARRCRTVPDVRHLRSSSSTGPGRRWRVMCTSCRRSAVAAVRETTNIYTHGRLRHRPRLAVVITHREFLSLDLYIIFINNDSEERERIQDYNDCNVTCSLQHTLNNKCNDSSV